MAHPRLSRMHADRLYPSSPDPRRDHCTAASALDTLLVCFDHAPSSVRPASSAFLYLCFPPHVINSHRFPMSPSFPASCSVAQLAAITLHFIIPQDPPVLMSVPTVPRSARVVTGRGPAQSQSRRLHSRRRSLCRLRVSNSQTDPTCASPTSL